MSDRYLELGESLGRGVDVDYRPKLDRMEQGPGLWIQPQTIVLSGRAEPGEKGAEFRGRLTGSCDLTCGRCLTRYGLPLDQTLFLIFTPQEVSEAGAELSDDDGADDTEFLFHAPEGIADLDDLIREQIWLALPLKPLCSVDCKGLCPTCGTDKNRIECDCRDEEIDPRLAPLLRFKQQNDPGTA